MTGRRAVFVDLNGTLVMPVQPSSLDELEPIAGVVEAIGRLNRADYVCPVVTVQSRIAKGIFTSAEFESWFVEFATRLASHGAVIVGPYVCPHLFSDPCVCEKPKTLLYERAVADHAIDVTRSWVVGDTAADLRAAAALNARPCLVRTGWGQREENAAAATELGALIVESLAAAVDVLLA